MKKFLRFISSGQILIFLFLFIEIIVVLILDLNLDQVIINALVEADVLSFETSLRLIIISSYVILATRVVFTIIAIVLFFKIINKYENPEFKVPWLVFLFVFPIITCTLFLIFANHTISRREKKIMGTYYQKINPYFSLTKKKNESFMKELDEACGAFEYIANTARVGIHKDNRVTYYKNGESFFPAFIEGLKKAKEFIFIEFFIITDGKEWSAVKEVLIQKALEGVDVRIVYDDMGSGGTISSFTPRRLRKYGIKCYKFHPFRPVLNGSMNNRDHRKIVIVDHQMAFTGGINLADEYANEIRRFGYWKDTMVKIEGSGISNLISTFLANYAIASKLKSGKAFKKILKYKLSKILKENNIKFEDNLIKVNRLKHEVNEKYVSTIAIMTSPMFKLSPVETAKFITQKLNLTEIQKVEIAKDGLMTITLKDDISRFLNYEYPVYKGEGFVMPFGDGPGGIDDALIGEQTYINLLNYAKKEVFISTPYLIPTYQLNEALRNAALRGVKVHLIVPGIPDKKLVYLVAKANFKPLLEAGVKIYTYTPGFNHMKSMLADDELSFVGTINFDFRSLVHHFECGTIIYKSEANKEIKKDFLEMVEASKEVPSYYRLNIFGRILCGIIKLIVPLL